MNFFTESIIWIQFIVSYNIEALTYTLLQNIIIYEASYLTIQIWVLALYHIKTGRWKKQKLKKKYIILFCIISAGPQSNYSLIIPIFRLRTGGGATLDAERRGVTWKLHEVTGEKFTEKNQQPAGAAQPPPPTHPPAQPVPFVCTHGAPCRMQMSVGAACWKWLFAPPHQERARARERERRNS
jgi:hypothetical protein